MELLLVFEQRMDADPEKMIAMLDAHHARMMARLGQTEATHLEANSIETEATVERQEIPNKEAAVHSMRAWQKETVACQVMTDVCKESKKPSPEEMESELERREVSTEEAAVKSS